MHESTVLQEHLPQYQTELGLVRQKVELVLEKAGFVFDKDSQHLPENLVQFGANTRKFLERYELNDELLSSFFRTREGLNEIITNYLTGLVLFGKLKDSASDYSSVFPIAQQFISSLTQRLLEHNKLLSPEKAREYIIRLLAEVALLPASSDTSNHELIEILKLHFSNLEEFKADDDSPQEIVGNWLETALLLFICQNNFRLKQEEPGMTRIGSLSPQSGEITNIYEGKVKFYKLRASLIGALLGVSVATLRYKMQVHPDLLPILCALGTSYFSIIFGSLEILNVFSRNKSRRLVYTHELIHQTSLSSYKSGTNTLAKVGLKRYRQKPKNFPE